MEIFKLLINSVLYRKGARFVYFDIKKLYLGTPLNRPEYAHIHLKDIPQEFITAVVCEVRPQKEDPKRTQITIGGNRIYYPGDVGTPTASLELFKLPIKSVFS